VERVLRRELLDEAAVPDRQRDMKVRDLAPVQLRLHAECLAHVGDLQQGGDSALGMNIPACCFVSMHGKALPCSP
jgi:hypothetical protein